MKLNFRCCWYVTLVVLSSFHSQVCGLLSLFPATTNPLIVARTTFLSQRTSLHRISYNDDEIRMHRRLDTIVSSSSFPPVFLSARLSISRLRANSQQQETNNNDRMESSKTTIVSAEGDNSINDSIFQNETATTIVRNIVVKNGGSNEATAKTTKFQNNNNEIYTTTITFPKYCHRPLGCTIEESLATKGVVLVTRVNPNSFAEQYGLQMGDHILGVSDLFGTMQSIVNSASAAVGMVDTVKALVASRPDEEVLQFEIIRNTNAMEEHERALVDVITNPDFDTDELTERGIIDYIKSGYDDSKQQQPKKLQQQRIRGSERGEEEEVEEEECNPFDDADCLVDGMYSMWADMEDYTVQSKSEAATDASISPKGTNAPWSSRSSPSGTYVRDPTTGKLRNIDE